MVQESIKNIYWKIYAKLFALIRTNIIIITIKTKISKNYDFYRLKIILKLINLFVTLKIYYCEMHIKGYCIFVTYVFLFFNMEHGTCGKVVWDHVSGGYYGIRWKINDYILKI